jgi:hypothetical protein
MMKTNPLTMGLLLSLFSLQARAQDLNQEQTVLTLAQQCVGEIDFENPAECRVMWHINLALTRAKQKSDPRWTLENQLRAYNSPFKVESPRTQWVRELNLAGVEPEHWKGDVPWAAKRDKWLALLEHARKFLEEPGRRPCPTANAYGGSCYNNPHGACDHVPSCWVQVVCHSKRQKPFAQAYYEAKRCSL